MLHQSKYSPQSLRIALVDFIATQQPYAHVTISSNLPKIYAFTMQDNEANRLLKFLKILVLKIDQSYLKTRDVANKRARHQRFEGFFFLEKLSGHPHVHIVMTIPSDHSREMWSDEKRNRIRFLEESLASGLLTKGESLSYQHPKNTILTQLVPSASCTVTEVHDAPKLASYVTKECLKQFNYQHWGVLSQFHPDHQLKQINVNSTNRSTIF